MGGQRGSGVIALLFPGQGSQFVGMGRDLADEFSAAARIFEQADEALGLRLSRIAWEGPESELTETRNAQPAILVHSVAVWSVLAERLSPRVELAAGHSLGEFSAYVAAGALPFEDAVRLVRRRGELMFRAGLERPGAMMAILGLPDDEAANRVCETASAESGGVVVAANFNSPSQVVISGEVDAVKLAGDIALRSGAKRAIPLSVSGAFHSPLMEAAVPGLREALAGAAVSDPIFPVVSNVTAEPVRTAAQSRDLLLRQLTAPVQWVRSVERMLADGITEFVEIGPGNVLTGLLRRIERSAAGRAVGTVEEVRALEAEG